MKILFIGLDGAAPDIFFSDESLINFRRLMEFGCYGELESTLPLSTEQAWLSIAIGRETGSAEANKETAIWAPIISQGKQAIITGWLPFEPPDRERLIVRRLDETLIADNGLHTSDKTWPKDQINSVTRKLFEEVQQLLQTEDWDYIQFIETGLDQIQRTPEQATIRNYYRYLDSELEMILGKLPDEVIVLVVSINGIQPEEHQTLDAGSTQLGFFILAAPNSPLSGEIEATRLMDIAPTLLELGGYEIPESMPGKSLLEGLTLDAFSETGLTADEEEILRERLSGLGYIS